MKAVKGLSSHCSLWQVRGKQVSWVLGPVLSGVFLTKERGWLRSFQLLFLHSTAKESSFLHTMSWQASLSSSFFFMKASESRDYLLFPFTPPRK